LQLIEFRTLLSANANAIKVDAVFLPGSTQKNSILFQAF